MSEVPFVFRSIKLKQREQERMPDEKKREIVERQAQARRKIFRTTRHAK